MAPIPSGDLNLLIGDLLYQLIAKRQLQFLLNFESCNMGLRMIIIIVGHKTDCNNTLTAD